MASEPTRGVNPVDMETVGEAVDLLREAGYAVDGVSDVERNEEHGVSFDLTLSRPNRIKPLGGEDEEVGE